MDSSIVTLHYTVDPILKEPVDQILYLIRHFIYNPGFITTTYKEFELSFRGIVTKYPYEPQKVIDEVNEKLGGALRRSLPDMNLTLTTTYEFVTETTYSLILKITDGSGNIIIPDVSVSVINNELTVKYSTM